ncbi:hypothetical protein [Actinocorallia sp. A-T 12471]|uniref:hypothetical protein n=1 Tax=Actinocorallia sp. A-T 12471 TaxID=3089813 RepID=UPI0029D23C94|nr:hypothetical protein [Actinocorallia sp. A-T 12471]MDX6742776.1 hypothetical protein [Actinocorallia sp. A-T 12471]
MHTPPASPSQPPAHGLRETIEDNVLNPVAEADRRSGWALLSNSAGVGTTLAMLLVGGGASYLVGVWWTIAMAAVSAAFGAVIGTLTGRVSQSTGTSSTVTSRFHGLGASGSALASLMFAAIIVCFLALENALLYHGTLFMLDMAPSTTNAVVIYGVLTLVWIGLALFGVRLVQRVSLALTVLASVLMIVVTVLAFRESPLDVGGVLGFTPEHIGGTEVMATLASMMGMVGALTLTNADFTRYARTAKDVRIMAVGGALIVNFGVVVLGALLYQAGDAVVAAYLEEPGRADFAAAQPGGTTAEKVQALAHSNAGAYFVVLAGFVGFLVMYAAQVKAQVINAYTSSLSLTNLVDALTGRAPSRVLMLLVANALALVAVWADILSLLGELLGALGIATCSLAALLIADFRLAKGRSAARVERVNWAGVVALVVGFGVSYALFVTDTFQLAFLVTLVLTPLLYTVLRTTVLTPGTGTGYVEATAALREHDGEEATA